MHYKLLFNEKVTGEAHPTRFRKLHPKRRACHLLLDLSKAEGDILEHIFLLFF